MTPPIPTNILEWAVAQFWDAPPSGLQAALSEVTSLPGLENWMPTRASADIVDVLILSAALRRIDRAAFPGLMKKLSRQLREGGRLDDDTEAELHAAALLAQYGLVREVPIQKNQKTPDLQGVFEGVSVEIEVTSAQTKAENVRRQTIAQKLTESLQGLPLGGYTVVHFVDGLSDVELSTVVEKVGSLPEGGSDENRGVWYIARPQTQEAIIERPDWAAHQYALPVTLWLSGPIQPDAMTSQNQILVSWSLPTDAY